MKQRSSFSAALVGVLLPLAVAGRFARADVPAREAPPDDRERESRALSEFQRGRERMGAGSYPEACRAFEASQKLDPGVGTMLNLAFCYEKLGETASAWAVYRAAAVSAEAQNRAQWQAAALARASRLEGTLLRVVIQVRPEPAGESKAVWVDGGPLPSEMWGEAVPLAPGRHELRAEAPNRQTWTMPFEVDPGPPPTLVVPALEPIAPVVVAAEPAKSPSPPVLSRYGARSTGDVQRTAALVLAGSGVAGLATALVLGIVAVRTYHDADCPNGGCSAAGEATQSRAWTEANAATVAVTVGGAAVAAGALVWFTAPAAHRSVQVQLGTDRGPLGASLRGVW